MTERQVTIKVDVQENGAGDRLETIKKQMAAIQGSVIKSRLQLDIQGQEQLTHFRRQLAATQKVAQSTLKVNVVGEDRIKSLTKSLEQAREQAKSVASGSTYRQAALFSPAATPLASTAKSRVLAASQTTIIPAERASTARRQVIRAVQDTQPKIEPTFVNVIAALENAARALEKASFAVPSPRQSGKRGIVTPETSLSAKRSAQRSEALADLSTLGGANARAKLQSSRTKAAPPVSALADLGSMSGALTSKAIPPLVQYQQMLGGVMRAGKAIGPGIISGLRGVSSEFQRQKELAAFWGISGWQQGIISAKSALSGFLATGGQGFTSWLQKSSANLAQYRTALAGATAVLIGMAAAAALSSKHSQNYIKSTLDTGLMKRKLTDKAGAEKWIESAQGTDWSAGRDSRMGVFQTVLSKNKAIGQQQAQKATEDIEKFFFANQEMLQKKGFGSAEQLASAISAPELSMDDATKFEDIFGLGFSRMSATARLGRLGTEAKDIDIDKAVQARPDEVLSKRLTATTAAMGDAVLPALNSVLGGFIQLSDIIGKIPGLGKAMGWGAVLMGAAAAGLIVVSMLGSLIPGIVLMKNAVMGETAAKYANITATYANSAASKAAAAGQWLLNAAMSANPLGIAIIAIAGLIVVLYALEKKFGLVTKAWKAFSESSTGKGIIGYIEDGKKAIEGMLASLNKAYKSGGVGGILKVALGAILSTSPLFKMVAFIYDILRKLWQNSATLNKLAASGSGLLQRVVDFFTWLLDAIKSGVQWIKDGLGITKQDAKTKMEEQAKKEGLVWQEAIGDNPAQWYKNGTAVGTNAGSDRLKRLKADYDNAPNSVFSKIGEVISGAMSNIKALFDPVLTPLSTAIGSLVKWLKSIFGNGDDETTTIPPAPMYHTGSDGKTYQGDTEVVDRTDVFGNKQKTFAPLKPDATPAAPAAPSSNFNKIGAQEVNLGLSAASGATYKFDPASANAKKILGMASGGSIIGSGLLVGHEREEVNPANVVAGGKTTLERINEMFSGARGNTGGQSISISAPITVQVGSVDSSIDLERALEKAGDEFDRKLLFRLRNQLDNGNTRGIGYLRG
jgi:hypothetical protein